MKNKTIKFISLFLALNFFITLLPLSALQALAAISVESGSHDAGDGIAKEGSYGCADLDYATGYRVCYKNKKEEVMVYDILRTTGDANSKYDSKYHRIRFVDKYGDNLGLSKIQILSPRDYKNATISRSGSAAFDQGRVHDDNALGTNIPQEASGLSGWVTSENYKYFDRVCNLFDRRTHKDIESEGSVITFEPLYMLKFNGQKYLGTVTEFALLIGMQTNNWNSGQWTLNESNSVRYIVKGVSCIWGQQAYMPNISSSLQKVLPWSATNPEPHTCPDGVSHQVTSPIDLIKKGYGVIVAFGTGEAKNQFTVAYYTNYETMNNDKNNGKSTTNAINTVSVTSGSVSLLPPHTKITNYANNNNVNFEGYGIFVTKQSNDADYIKNKEYANGVTTRCKACGSYSDVVSAPIKPGKSGIANFFKDGKILDVSLATNNIIAYVFPIYSNKTLPNTVNILYYNSVDTFEADKAANSYNNYHYSESISEANSSVSLKTSDKLQIDSELYQFKGFSIFIPMSASWISNTKQTDSFNNCIANPIDVSSGEISEFFKTKYENGTYTVTIVNGNDEFKYSNGMAKTICVVPINYKKPSVYYYLDYDEYYENVIEEALPYESSTIYPCNLHLEPGTDDTPLYNPWMKMPNAVESKENAGYTLKGVVIYNESIGKWLATNANGTKLKWHPDYETAAKYPIDTSSGNNISNFFPKNCANTALNGYNSGDCFVMGVYDEKKVQLSYNKIQQEALSRFDSDISISSLVASNKDVLYTASYNVTDNQAASIYPQDYISGVSNCAVVRGFSIAYYKRFEEYKYFGYNKNAKLGWYYLSDIDRKYNSKNSCFGFYIFTGGEKFLEVYGNFFETCFTDSSESTPTIYLNTLWEGSFINVIYHCDDSDYTEYLAPDDNDNISIKTIFNTWFRDEGFYLNENYKYLGWSFKPDSDVESLLTFAKGDGDDANSVDGYKKWISSIAVPYNSIKEHLMYSGRNVFDDVTYELHLYLCKEIRQITLYYDYDKEIINKGQLYIKYPESGITCDTKGTSYYYHQQFKVSESDNAKLSDNKFIPKNSLETKTYAFTGWKIGYYDDSGTMTFFGNMYSENESISQLFEYSEIEEFYAIAQFESKSSYEVHFYRNLPQAVINNLGSDSTDWTRTEMQIVSDGYEDSCYLFSYDSSSGLADGLYFQFYVSDEQRDPIKFDRGIKYALPGKRFANYTISYSAISNTLYEMVGWRGADGKEYYFNNPEANTFSVDSSDTKTKVLRFDAIWEEATGAVTYRFFENTKIGEDANILNMPESYRNSVPSLYNGCYFPDQRIPYHSTDALSFMGWSCTKGDGSEVIYYKDQIPNVLLNLTELAHIEDGRTYVDFYGVWKVNLTLNVTDTYFATPDNPTQKVNRLVEGEIYVPVTTITNTSSLYDAYVTPTIIVNCIGGCGNTTHIDERWINCGESETFVGNVFTLVNIDNVDDLVTFGNNYASIEVYPSVNNAKNQTYGKPIDYFDKATGECFTKTPFDIYTPSIDIKIRRHSSDNTSYDISKEVFSGQQISLQGKFTNNSSFDSIFDAWIYNAISFNREFYMSENIIKKGASVLAENCPSFFLKNTTNRVRNIFVAKAYMGWSCNDGVDDYKEALVNVHPIDLKVTNCGLYNCDTQRFINEAYEDANLLAVVDCQLKTTLAPINLMATINVDVSIEDYNGNLTLIDSFVVKGANFTSCVCGADGYYYYYYSLVSDAATPYNVNVYQGRSLVVSATINETGALLNGYSNAEFEMNAINNKLVRSFEIVRPYVAEFVTPNAFYVKGTEVISAFKVENHTSQEITDNGIFSLSVRNDLTGEVYSNIYTGNYAVPAKSETLIWAKWTIPDDTSGEVPYGLILDLDLSNVIQIKPQIVETGWFAIDKIVSQTPDTTFSGSQYSQFREIDAENNLSELKSIYSSGKSNYIGTIRNNALNKSSWTYWVYDENDGFTKKTDTYDAGTSNVCVSITPSGMLNFDNNRAFRSGYGFTLLAALDNKTALNDTSAITGVQNAIASFPEFNNELASKSYGSSPTLDNLSIVPNLFHNYPTGFNNLYDTSTGTIHNYKNIYDYGLFATLDLSDDNVAFELPKNASMNDIRVHFTPIWLKNNYEYKVNVVFDNLWTPGGMITSVQESNCLEIEGDMFDDYVTKYYTVQGRVEAY